MTDWNSQFSGGPAPIGPYADLIQLHEIEEAALVRGERAMRRAPDDQPDEATE
jgi:hypothetical protein